MDDVTEKVETTVENFEDDLTNAVSNARNKVRALL